MKCIICDVCGKKIENPKDIRIVRVYKPYKIKKPVLTDKERDPIEIDEMLGEPIIFADVCTTCLPQVEELLSRGQSEDP